jgi:hypothetical protein
MDRVWVPSSPHGCEHSPHGPYSVTYGALCTPPTHPRRRRSARLSPRGNT